MRQGSTSRQPAHIPSDIKALNLRQSTSEAQYLNEFLRLIRYREGLSTLPYQVPSRKGLVGHLLRWLKKLLWRLLNYQHARIAFRQNLINNQLTSALWMESLARQNEISALKQRIAALEKNEN